jgi:acetyl esterase/lipase
MKLRSTNDRSSQEHVIPTEASFSAFEKRGEEDRPRFSAWLQPLRLGIIVALSLTGTLLAQKAAWQPPPGTTTLPLWPHGTMANRPEIGPESNLTTPKDYLVAGRTIIRLADVSDPTLTLYPPTRKNTGAAIVVFPGGGYNILVPDLEGSEVCDWLTPAGIACILVKYRVPGSGPYPKSSLALEDAQRTLGLVRSHATEWHIDPDRIGVLGFSAGGHLAVALSTHFDQRLYKHVDAADDLSCRPDFAVLIYPAYLVLDSDVHTLAPDMKPNERTPPAFILQAEDDGIHVENAIQYFLALKEVKVPAELHVYAQGGHGYGLRRRSDLPVTDWPMLVDRWLRTIKVVSNPAP